MGLPELIHIKGISQKRLEYLTKIGIYSVIDLITYFPKSYQDYSVLNTLDEVFDEPEKTLLIHAYITQVTHIKTKSRIPFQKITIRDSTANATLLAFGVKGQYYKADENKLHLIRGVFKYQKGKIESSSFAIEGSFENHEMKNIQKNLQRILPFYNLTNGITQKLLRSFIKQALTMMRPYLKEALPEYIAEQYQFLSRAQSFEAMHFPIDYIQLETAKRRFKYTELFRLQVQMALKQYHWKAQKTQIYTPPFRIAAQVEKSLPFLLTFGQKKALADIETDLLSSKAMHRLLMADVGSGKTLVALLSLIKVIESGYQGVLLAPTEVLAKQHFKTAQQLLQETSIKIELITGSTPSRYYSTALYELKNGDIDLLIGTHALFSEHIQFRNLALVVIDEQHKFGVEQRMRLVQKGQLPDVLSMSATPIPRTLGYIQFGDMDISIIKDKPVGRLPIQTIWLEESKLQEAYEFMRQQVQQGHQGYIVYPLVEESEKSDIKSVVEGFHFLRTQIFSEFQLALLHGKMNSDDKSYAIQQFNSGKAQILVATMVIEVGIDVPNSTCMIIENATRFGLSTLHQLRGRIGRSHLPSTCFIISKPREALSIEAQERMNIMETCDDGFLLAEKDMQLRGIGNLLGKNQSGKNPFKIANFMLDVDILEAARQDAFNIVFKDPHCQQKQHQVLLRWLQQFESEFQGILHN